jgi:acyl carrier protein
VEDLMMQEMEVKIRRIIKGNVKTKVPVEDIGRDESLVDFGVNSMNFIKIVVELENEFKVLFDNETLRFDEMNTINKLIDCVISLMN